MSALCQKQTFDVYSICLVGGGEQRRRNGNAEHLGGLQIDE
jgi:hypothetical protein